MMEAMGFQGIPSINLHSSRLLIREFVENDWSTTHVYGSDPEVVKYMDWGPNSEAQTTEYIRRVIACQKEIPRKTFELAVVVRENSLHVGGCRLGITSVINREADMGYTLRRDYWNKGIATEAARTIIDFGFRRLGMHRIWATAAPNNLASQRVLEKIGMTREGLLRENVCRRGVWRNSVLFAILEDDWNATDLRTEANTDVVITRATPAHVNAILKLAEENSPERGGGLTGHLRREAVMQTIQAIPSVVAIEQEQLIGFLLAWEKSPSNPPHIQAMLDAYSGSETSYVYGPICVAAEARGRGVAERMFSELRLLLPGREGILFIKKNNQPSLRAHLKMGMREVVGYTHNGTEFLVFAYKG
jgi:ribosomal-protein-alanine N-acetyltransferase